MSVDLPASAPLGRGKIALYDSVLAAIDNLLAFVKAARKDRPSVKYADLLRLDQRVCSACQVVSLPLPPFSHEGGYSPEMIVGFCRIPILNTTEGVILFEDDGWMAAMEGV